MSSNQNPSSTAKKLTCRKRGGQPGNTNAYSRSGIKPPLRSAAHMGVRPNTASTPRTFLPLNVKPFMLYRG